MAFACDEDKVSPTHAFTQNGDVQDIASKSEAVVNSGVCETGCCIMGCSCCSLPSFDTEATRGFSNLLESTELVSLVRSAHTILPLRPPIS